MKILHFLTHFSLLSETFVYDEINALEAAHPGGNVILTFERSLEAERPFPRVHALPRSLSPGQRFRRRCLKLFRGINVPRELWSLHCYLDRHLEAFDVLQAHFGWNAVTLCQVLSRLPRHRHVPMVVRCQGSDINSLPVLNSEYRIQLLELARRPRLVLAANSEFLRQKLISLGIDPEKIHVVFNAFNPAFLNHRKKRFFKPGAELKLINTARFIEWKGQAYLVKAFARFRREVYANSSLTLVGEGETLARVKALAGTEEVSSHVHFLGGIAHAEIGRMLGAHDVYLQPSIRDPQTFQEEGMPLAVLEALAVGLPLIVTRTGGMPEIIGADNPFGRVVPDRDADAIFFALKEMFEAGSCFQDSSDFSRERLELFSQARQMEELEAAYRKVLDARPRGSGP